MSKFGTVLDEQKLQYIENNHPNYYHDDRVLHLDILSRWLDDDEVSDADERWIEDEWGGNASEVARYVSELQEALYNEAIEASAK